MTHAADEPLKDLTDKTVARIRTVLPGIWGTIVGQVLLWLVGRGLLPDVMVQWQGAVTGATTVVVTGVAVWAVYALAQWVEARESKLARFIATALLLVLKQPTYPAASPAALSEPHSRPEGA